MSKLVQTLAGRLLLVLFSLTMLLNTGTMAFAATSSRTETPGDMAGYESWLATEVRHQLVTLPWYSVFDNLEYRVDGSEVTLLGQVVNPTLKIDAGNAVKNIEGVTKVVNDIEILPPSPMDDQIRRAEFRAIFGEPALERYAMGSVPAIHIVVKEGHVTLEGVVASQSDKDVVNIRANTVPGIFSVTNNLRLESDRK
jgi:hyperosmotically inducible periplasmic protein